jgi:hypothetical protein
MQSEPIIVMVRGRCITDVIGVKAYDVFDWDNFENNPEVYVEDRGGLDGEYFQTISNLSQDAFADIEDAYYKAIRYRADQKHKDPFWMVEAR